MPATDGEAGKSRNSQTSSRVAINAALPKMPNARLQTSIQETAKVTGYRGQVSTDFPDFTD